MSRCMGAEAVMFQFGDSLIDVGNNNQLKYCLAKADFPWYGIDYNGGIPTGRFTNGRTISDIIADRMGLHSPPPYLSSSAKNEDFKGFNYASGGSGILNETGFVFIEKISFDTQIDNFQATKEALTKKIGAVATENLLNEAFYIIVIGGNDYINNYLLPLNVTKAQQNTPDQFAGLLITSLQRQLKRIHQIGARKIVFNGIGPVGCVPFQRKKNGGSCLEHVNEWVQKFNVVLKKLLLELNSELPGFNITYADTYNSAMEVITNPLKYGFDVSDAPCCSVDTIFGQFCFPSSKLCADRSKYVFWDAFHPTDAANMVFSEMLLSNPGLRLQFNFKSPAPSAPASPASTTTTTVPALSNSNSSTPK